MKIGGIDLGNCPLFLAPMEDVTYKSFRFMCKKFGANVLYTEFISADALIRNVKKTKQKLHIFDFDRPVAVQIYGHDKETMIYAAKIAEEVQPDFIDINLGCPMKKIFRRGAGAALLGNLPYMQELVGSVVKAVNIPVTAKIRLGIDQGNKPTVEIARRLQDAGVTAIAVHGRTADQFYSGKADWDAIGEVKNHPSIHIPVIGNGDITGPEAALRFMNLTKVDGLMIGRSAIGRPWIFKEIRHYLDTGKILPPPMISDIVSNIREQLQINFEVKGNELSAILMMRRHFARYFPGIPDFREMNVRLLRAETIQEVNHILSDIISVYGNHNINYQQ
jgi:tRNA-dihydrouridine synthase B